MATIYISRPSSGNWFGDANMTLQSQENMERLWQTIQSARLGTITPSVAAMTCFTWLIDIINGRCPPFYPETKAKMKDQPGDTPGMREFHDRFCGYLMMNSGLSDDKAQDLLIEFTVEYWSLLRTKKWIYRGETMVLPSLGMDRIVSGHGPVYWPHTVPGFGAPRPEGIPRLTDRLRREKRFLALIRKHMGFSWMERAMYESFTLPLGGGRHRRRSKESFETTVIILEITGRELYTSPRIFRIVPLNYEDEGQGSETMQFEDDGSGVGEYRKRWPEWIAKGHVLMADESYSEEFKEAVRRVIEVMEKIEETVKKEEAEQRAVEVEAKASANAS